MRSTAELYEALLPKLSDDKRAWVLEDGAELVANLQRESDPEEAYREVKQAWRLKSQQLAVLKVLTARRERQARRATSRAIACCARPVWRWRVPSRAIWLRWRASMRCIRAPYARMVKPCWR